MSENTFDDFDFDMEPMPLPLDNKTDKKQDQTPDSKKDQKQDQKQDQKPDSKQDQKPDSKQDQKQDLDDEDLKPVTGLDALDNVSIDIPTHVEIKSSQTTQEEAAASKHQKDVLSEMLSSDAEEQAEIQRLMSNRRALSERLQKDPEFDKRYKRAEREYFDRVNGKQSAPDASVPNDELYKQAQALVERLHNKTGSHVEQNQDQNPTPVDPKDPHGLSRFGEVLQDVPEDPEDQDSDFEELSPKKKTKKNNEKQATQPSVIIKKVKTLNLNIYFNQ